MQSANFQASVPIPAEFMDITNDYFASIGLEDLPLSVKYAFAQEMYPRALDISENTNEVPLWEPYNSMQKLAKASLAFETFCGGRARSGKTDLLLGLSFTEHQSSIIFRPEFSQMEALEERSRELLRGTGARYNASPIEKRWRDIPGGRTLKFGAIKYDGDVDKYFGRPHDLVAFDEIAKFKEKHYLSVWAWACTVVEDQRVRIVCAGNPPTSVEELWVKRRWAAWVDDTHPNPAKPGELRWYVRKDGKDTEVEGPDAEVIDEETGKPLKPLSRTFIPGELLDFYKGTTYEAALDALPESLRPQLRDGDFSAIQEDQPQQVIQAAWVRLAQQRWEAMDKPNIPLRAVGVDVARGGEDQTVISKRWGNWYAPLIKYRGIETKTGNDVAAVVVENMLDTEKGAQIVLDLAGVGSSPYDILVSHSFRVDGFIGASASELTDKSQLLSFANRRAEAWWKFAEALNPDSGEEIALPPDPELMEDLTSVRWKLTTRGIQIEDKEEIKNRIGHSPDCGDSVVMNYNADVRLGQASPTLLGAADLGYIKRY